MANSSDSRPMPTAWKTPTARKSIERKGRPRQKPRIRWVPYSIILHKQGYPEAGEEEEEHSHRDDDRQGSLTGKADGVLHAGNVAAGIVIADQRHDALRDAL